MMPTWGTPDDVKQLEQLFDAMKGFCARNDIPAFIGEFGVTTTKESASRIRWMSAVMNASLSRRMVPVLWDTGSELSRHEPYAASPELIQTLKNLVPASGPEPTVSIPDPAPTVPSPAK
jgi:endoglucanase